MLKKLMTIILVVELGLLYLPEKYIFASEDDPQAETEETTSEEPTIPTIPEMSGIEDTTTPTKIEPVMIPEDEPMEEVAPMEETAPVEPTNQPAELINTIAPQNDLPTEDKWFVFNGTTNTITGYSSSTSAPKNINIPSTIGGIPVYNIGESAFSGQQLTGLTLPNGLTSIGNKAFSNNPSVVGNLVIPDSVIYIGDSVFEACSGLSSVTIGNIVTGIGNRAFYSCSGLTNVTIGKSVIWIGSEAFDYCRSLTSIVIPNSVTTIGNSTFSGCTGLTSITFGNSVTSIGYSAFYGCSSLTNITIPDSVTTIQQAAFFWCERLTSVTIGKGVSIIEEGVFDFCESLTRIDIPGKNEGEIYGAPWNATNAVVYWKDVKQAGEYLLNTTSGEIKKYTGTATILSIPNTLTVDGIPYSVKKIGDKAFYKNTTLTSVTIPDNVINIATTAFNDCSSLSRIDIPGKNEGEISGAPWGAPFAIVYWKDVKQAGEYLFNIASGTILKYTGTTAILSIPSTLTVDGTSYQVKMIGNNAFRDNKALTNITISSSVTSIGSSAFSGCNALTIINIPGKNDGEISGALWGAVSNTKVYWKDVKQAGDYIFNTTTGTIKKYTGTATTVNIPSTLSADDTSYAVLRIGDNGFSGNYELTSVTIPDSVTNIEDYAFRNCRSLTSVMIGNGVTSIKKNVFEYCNSLTRIDIPGKNEGEILGAPWKAENAVLYWKDTKQVGDYLFSFTGGTIAKYNGISTTLNIPNTLIVGGISYPVKTIGDNAFYNNKTLTNVTIPDSVTNIGSSAFSGCSALTSINIPSKNEGEIKGRPWGAPKAITYWKNVKQVGDYVFAPTSGTIRKYLGTDSVITIPSYFTLDDTDYPVKAIYTYAFYKNQTITNITIPDSVTSIGKNAFENCRSLTNVTIGNSVTSIESYTFEDCSGLTSIVIPDSVTSIEFGAFAGCSSLTQAVISKNLNSMRDTVFNNTPALQTIYIRASRAGLPSSITSAQPWGAPATSTVWYGGDIITFDHTVKKVTGQYNRILDIRAFVNKPALINRIILPNGTIKYVGKSDWPDETGYYPYGSITEETITANGTFVFKGYGDDNVERSYTVVINDIGSITIRANEASITEQVAATASEQDVLDILNVSAEDEAGAFTNGTDCTIWISPEDMNKIHALHLGDVTTIRVNVKSSRSGKEMTSYRDVTLNTTSCVIHADNVDLWPIQSKNLTKQELIGLMNASVVDSEGVADMTKLDIADDDFNKIKTGTPGIYNVLLTYATNKSKKRVRVTIMDDSPSVLIKIPSEIKMKKISNDTVYGVGAEETVSIQSFVNTTLYPNPFKIETNPSFWLESTAPDAAWINRMKVVVLDANDQPLPDNHLLATLSGSTIQSAPFKLRGYHNKWNSKGAYSGIMTFTITYEELTP